MDGLALRGRGPDISPRAYKDIMQTVRVFLLLMVILHCTEFYALGQDPLPKPVLPPEVPVAQRLTLSQAIDAAFRNNPQRLASGHMVASSRNNLSSQRAIINPNIQFSGLNNTVSSLNFRNPSNYVFSGVIETSGRRAVRTQIAKAQYEGVLADGRTTQLTVEQAVTAAYISLQTANLAFQSELQAYADARRISELTEQQFKLGAVPETNSMNARIALEQELNNLTAVGATVEQSRAALNQAIGAEPSTPVDVAETLEFAPQPPTLADLQEQALRNRPEIQSAEASKRALKATVKQQKSLYYPDVFAQVSARFDGIFLGLSVPAFDFGSIRSSVRKAQEDVSVQEAQIQQARHQVKLDVETAWLALRQAQAQAARSRDQIVPRAQQVFAKIEQGYRLGGNTILDLLSAQATIRAARNDYNTALGNSRMARAQLERAIGRAAPK